MGADLGRVVRSARVALGLTQAQVASRLHCSASTVSRFQTGKQPLRDMRLLHELARVLEISPDRLGLAATKARAGDVAGDPLA
ncbi:hypothetical protein Acsp04_64780 [Actinomadura sp. NBRC 104425]|uniref:helix-turn-helix transcriptional regulator n=1 Tax=Actinomadura sp. NBRC 104425 TaxID=3032204 RepID=UPI0024A1E746|nr:hypothetical protein Acsp04_64780 [Actinomadura sp. NBRC 104425]